MIRIFASFKPKTGKFLTASRPSTDSKCRCSRPNGIQFLPTSFLVNFKNNLDVSALVISASYLGREFIKVGYYVHYQLPGLSKTEK